MLLTIFNTIYLIFSLTICVIKLCTLKYKYINILDLLCVKKKAICVMIMLWFMCSHLWKKGVVKLLIKGLIKLIKGSV